MQKCYISYKQIINDSPLLPRKKSYDFLLSYDINLYSCSDWRAFYLGVLLFLSWSPNPLFSINFNDCLLYADQMERLCDIVQNNFPLECSLIVNYGKVWLISCLLSETVPVMVTHLHLFSCPINSISFRKIYEVTRSASNYSQLLFCICCLT